MDKSTLKAIIVKLKRIDEQSKRCAYLSEKGNKKRIREGARIELTFLKDSFYSIYPKCSELLENTHPSVYKNEYFFEEWKVDKDLIWIIKDLEEIYKNIDEKDS